MGKQGDGQPLKRGGLVKNATLKTENAIAK
jgi:hypothetical protein